MHEVHVFKRNSYHFGWPKISQMEMYPGLIMGSDEAVTGTMHWDERTAEEVESNIQNILNLKASTRDVLEKKRRSTPRKCASAPVTTLPSPVRLRDLESVDELHNEYPRRFPPISWSNLFDSLTESTIKDTVNK